MPAFIEQIRRVITTHRMLVADDSVLVGVSGGADSIAAALALIELGWRIGIAHLNHGLRGAESDEDEAFVARFAADRDLPCFIRRVNIGERGHNIEAAGRTARKEFFTELQRGHGYTKIALGHNREDRIETFLINLLRGAGPQGLTSMAPVSGVVVRPLIESPRADIEAYLQDRTQAWRVDRTNADMSFLRNRLRHEIVPRLGTLFNARLAETLLRTIKVLADEDQWLGQLAQNWMREHAKPGEGEVILPAKILQTEAPALARRVIRAGLEQAGSHLTDVTFDQIESVRRLLEQGQSGKTVELPGRMIATREFERLVLRPRPAEAGEFSYTLRIPGAIHIPEIGRTFRASMAGAVPQSSGKASVLVDAGKLGGSSVEIRNWRPGDYYRPVGLASAKVKKLFRKAGIPRWQRKSWPVVAQGSRLIWVFSFPASRDYAADADSEKIVAFEALPD